MLPALRHTLEAQADAIACGDWVLARDDGHGTWWAFERLPPITQLARRLHDGRDKVERVVIVSNVDTALLVMGLDGDFSPRRLERFVALARLAGVEAVVVLTKADLRSDAQARQQQVAEQVGAGVPVLALDARDAAAVRRAAEGCTLLFHGANPPGYRHWREHGLPMLEAMACRTPVVGVPIGAAPELLPEGGGELVPSESPQAMADALVRLLSEPVSAWRLRSQQAHVRAHAYSWDDATQRLLALLNLHANVLGQEGQDHA
jgi:glycosyltransferase involved in cell wall biosynthesis